MADTQSYSLPLGYRLDDYLITNVLGQGGFGITYRAQDVRLQRDVAIKEYLPRQFADRGADLIVRPRDESDREMFDWGLSRFIEEARALALFRHPNIVSVARYLEANGTAYLVMDYEDGDNLEAWLRGHPEGMPESMLVERILVPLLDGLARVHEKGLLHRDIKPDNIFIRGDGTPVLIDFGASRPHGQGAATQLTSIISAGYSPFEQYGGSSRQGPWTDIYSLAGTLYRVVTGRKPADAIARQQGDAFEPAAELGRGRYSPRLLRAIDLGLAIDPTQRPQSAAAFRALVESGTTAGSAADPDATLVRPNPGKPAARRERARAGLVAAAVVLLAAAAGALYYVTGDGTTSPTPPAIASVTPADPESFTTGEPVDTQAPVPDIVPAAATPEPTATEPTDEPVPAAPAALDEDAILAGLDVPDSVNAFRDTQIAGALLAYVSNRSKFDACMASGCPEQLALMQKVKEALDGYAWDRAPLRGMVRIVNPRRLDGSECPFMLDVEEVISTGAEERSQTRTYCTRNGFERVLQESGPVRT